MPKRTICVQNPATLHVSNNSLVIEQNNITKGSIPLEDIWVVILETHCAQITTAAMSKLVDAGIGVMLCGDDHMPNGLLLPLGAHSRHAAIVDDQLAISKPFQKRLWQRIVQAKITNQAAVLDYLHFDNSEVHAQAKEVLSGDTSNRESVAASIYFKKILPKGGRRNSRFSKALDYGYMVLRAGIGRAAVAGGWLVSRGIHHSNNLNAFNLVDDLIEPFRPIVDLLVLTLNVDDQLTTDTKHKLAEIFEYVVEMPTGKTSLQTAIEEMLASLRLAVVNDNPSLLQLPVIIPLKKANFE